MADHGQAHPTRNCRTAGAHRRARGAGRTARAGGVREWRFAAAACGVYAVGDASPAVQLVIVAAAQGASAATHIQSALLAEDMGLD
jgi:hypothetical protein